MPVSDPDRHAFSGRTMLVVLAHPDDESLATGGLIARAVDAGARVVLICGSRGERGSVSDRALLGHRTIADVRAAELVDAAAVLGIHTVIQLDHPDGSLQWANVPIFHADIVAAIQAHQPDLVVTFDEDGLYWHKDHIGVHERTLTAVASFGEAAPPLYYVTMPPGIIAGIIDTAQGKGGAPPDSSFWGISPIAFGLHDEHPELALDVRPWAHRKLQALRCHKTQMGPQNPISWITDEDAERWLGRELFRRSPLPTAMPRLLDALCEPLERPTPGA